ncbi:MAG: 1-acyl-sn-glycerol-3-phosphate acyltransferase [Deltaproteobacteria bacterium]|nr:1-acyl-sn-glycerol-3-phosphate acyltransferase [Deltaproteobacteria bacterium]
MGVAVFRSMLGLLATAAWATLALLLRPFFRRSVAVLQPLWARTVLRLAGVRVSVHPRAPVHGPVVYAANHQSGLDILVLIGCMPDSVRFVAKREMANAPFTGWCMRAADYVFIDRSNSARAIESLKAAAADLRSGGRSLVMFPEGTRYHPGELGPFKMGAFHLALQAGVPLVPVGLRGTGDLMERRSLMCRAGSVELHVGEPVDPAAWVGREKELRDHVRRQVRELAGPTAARDASQAAVADARAERPERRGSAQRVHGGVKDRQGWVQ